MRKLTWLFCGILLWGAAGAAAQENGLVVEDVSVSTAVDAFGLEVTLAEGLLVNEGDTAYSSISLLAEVYGADDELIGEGFGYLVTACGEALLPGFTMRPGLTESFVIPLDIFDPEAEIARVEVTAEASEADTPTGQTRPALLRGITEVTRREVVRVEWIDSASLRYGAGCRRDLFTEYAWYEYNLSTGVQRPAEHPRAGEITDTLRSALGLETPELFERSFFSFAPGERRAVYQTDLNTLVTVEPDGSFGRVLYDRLYNISLQGIHFPTMAGGVFIAYFYGGYGDPVSYITANVNGQQLSQSPKDPENATAINPNLTSITLPGVSPDGKRVIVTREVNGVTGYYLRATDTDFSQLLFEAEPPGNNWPAPVYHITTEGQRFVYVARPVEGEARLQCYNITSQQLHDLARLPLELAEDARGAMWLAPDGAHLALVADGVAGGLWLVDLTALDGCE